MSPYEHLILLPPSQDPWRLERLIVMRHGEAEHNVSRIIQTDPSHPTPLTEKGRAQVQEQASKLLENRVHAIYSSPLLRAQQSADILGKIVGLNKVSIEDRLREGCAGKLEGKPLVDYDGYYRRAIDRFYHPLPEGESEKQVMEYVSPFIDALIWDKTLKGKTALLVTHGVTAQMIYLHLSKVDPIDHYGTEEKYRLEPAEYTIYEQDRSEPDAD